MSINQDEALKQAGFDFEEIKSVKKWLQDIEEWNVFSENVLFSRLEKRLFSQGTSHV